MQCSSDNSYPSDICLLLRAHGEHFWLTSQVLPVLRQLERAGGVPEQEIGAALAYLEVLWLDAKCRAAETDAALSELLAAIAAGNGNAHGNGNVHVQMNGNSSNGNCNGHAHMNGHAIAHGAPARPFLAEARRYHAAVCALRTSVGVRVARLTGARGGGHPHERAAL